MPVQLDPLEPPTLNDGFVGDDETTAALFDKARRDCGAKANRIAEEHQKLARKIWVGWFVPALVGMVGSVATATTATLAGQGVLTGGRARYAAIGSSIGVTTVSAIGIFVRSAVQAPERRLEQQRRRYFEISRELERTWKISTTLGPQLRAGEGDAFARIAEETDAMRGVCAGMSGQPM